MTEPITDAIEIASNTYWVGHRDPESIFFANPYLRVFPKQNGRGPLNILIDPGASNDFAVVQAKCATRIGRISNLSAVFINHQDPDVCSVVGTLLARFARNALILCSEDTWRLVHFFNISKSRYLCVDPYVEKGMLLPTGHELHPVPSPYCHFAGATMLYDVETRVLFSGDLFGAVTPKGVTGMWADESDWAGLRTFHQLYMPARAGIRFAIKAIRALNPPPKIIAPQHGRLLKGEVLQNFMQRLEELPVGVDLLEDRNMSSEELAAWSTVLHRVVERSRTYLGPAAEARLVDNQQLANALDVDEKGIRVRKKGKWAVEQAVQLLTRSEPPPVANAVRYEAIYAASELDLPTPAVGLADEGAAPEQASQLKDIRAAH